MQYILNSDLEYKTAIIKITTSYNKAKTILGRNLNVDEIYDITRGYWHNRIDYVKDVKLVLAVINQIVVEVFCVDEWVKAEQVDRKIFPYTPLKDKNRVAFIGREADEKIRNAFVGKSISKLVKKGDRHSVIVKSNDDLSPTITIIEDELEKYNVKGIMKEQLVKVRVNQSIFRDRLLKKYKHCCLCNVSNPQLLIASHIKPWSECEDSEKLLVDNGFLLCPNHDSLFNKGLISFNDDGTIIISDKLDETNRLFMNVNTDMKVKVYEGNIPFLKYHRERYMQENNNG